MANALHRDLFIGEVVWAKPWKTDARHYPPGTQLVESRSGLFQVESGPGMMASNAEDYIMGIWLPDAVQGGIQGMQIDPGLTAVEQAKALSRARDRLMEMMEMISRFQDMCQELRGIIAELREEVIKGNAAREELLTQLKRHNQS